MKIFLTGATGVVGRRAVPLMLQAGHELTLLMHRPAPADVFAPIGVHTVQADLFDRGAVYEAVCGHEAVVNLATHIPATTLRMLLPGAWNENDRIRREGAANLADAASAAGVKRLVQESFALVYPDQGDRWINEDSPIEPVRYNRTVPDAERAAQRFTANAGTGVVLRFGAFYGPDARQTRDMIGLVRRGWAPLPGAPEAYFSSISHDDAASAVLAGLGLQAGIYNVVDDEPMERREFAGSLATAVGVGRPKSLPAWMTRVTGSLGEIMSRSERISNRKLRESSRWAPAFPSVRTGWPATVAALQASIPGSSLH
ncbi:MAG TPA: NAD(P)H-binding protein [Steroidobacteraceae bacterium]|jgi:nucleoside-diphosphate-sugar epimerase